MKHSGIRSGWALVMMVAWVFMGSSHLIAEDAVPLDPEPGETDTWLDVTRNWIYDTSHGVVEWVDKSLVDKEQQEVLETPPSRFRLGVISTLELKPEGKIEFSPKVDFVTDVELPNLEERFKLFITTEDPVALQGEDAFEEENSLRVGASKGFSDHWDVSAGVKTKWVPEAFAYLQWNRQYGEMPGWTTYPNLKLFWEYEDGFGASSALVLNRWKERRLFRKTFSVRISQEQMDEDEKKAADEQSAQFGDDGEGVRWLSSTLVGFVPILLNEKIYGRRVGGEDVAQGLGVRGQIRGNAVKVLEGKLTLYAKSPVYKDFIYLIVAPEVVWKEEQSWKEEWVLNVGVEMLLWGDDPF